MAKRINKNRFAGKYLCIMDNGLPLIPIEIARLLSAITDDDVALLAKGQPRNVTGFCEIRGTNVGQGVCLAYKYEKYGSKRNPMCENCKSDSIVKQLNYIFEQKYGPKYHAEWRRKNTKDMNFK